MSETSASQSELFTPPGGLMIWLFIFLELLAFSMAFGVFAFQMAGDPNMLRESQAHLNVRLATLNTLVLITSGYFAALGVAEFKEGRSTRSASWVRGAAAMGCVFAALKGLEYWEKIQSGHNMGFNSFFSFYWALTGFHLLHVLMGIWILLHFAAKVRRKEAFADPDVTLETGVAFWHMCDLIWVILFPLLYLIR